jgi:hypothetical protein
MKRATVLLMLGLAAVPGGLTACAGGGDDETLEPWAYCRGAGTVDAPETLPLDPDATAALVGRVRETFDLADDMPAEVLEAGTVWRCMDGQVWACVVGANLPCSEKADTSRTPSEAVREHCREQPDAEVVPANVTGRATVYSWRCVNGQPEVDGQWSKPDAQGFHAEIWRRVEPPPAG